MNAYFKQTLQKHTHLFRTDKKKITEVTSRRCVNNERGEILSAYLSLGNEVSKQDSEHEDEAGPKRMQTLTDHTLTTPTP